QRLAAAVANDVAPVDAQQEAVATAQGRYAAALSFRLVLGSFVLVLILFAKDAGYFTTDALFAAAGSCSCRFAAVTIGRLLLILLLLLLIRTRISRTLGIFILIFIG